MPLEEKKLSDLDKLKKGLTDEIRVLLQSCVVSQNRDKFNEKIAEIYNLLNQYGGNAETITVTSSDCDINNKSTIAEFAKNISF